MDTVGYFGLAVILLCAGAIVVSLYTGRVMARWPVPAFDRNDQPAGFWLTIFIYAIGAGMGALLAVNFLG